MPASHLLDDRLPSAFWAHVTTEGDCWTWTGAHNSLNGQPLYLYTPEERASRRGHPRRDYAQRVAYARLVRKIPSEVQLDQTCGNTSCVNPAHLVEVWPTIADFVAAHDGSCVNGHKLTTETVTGPRVRDNQTWWTCTRCLSGPAAQSL
jgi:hypothetical protein